MTDKNKKALEALKFIEFCNSAGCWHSDGVGDKLETIRQALERPQVDVDGLVNEVAEDYFNGIYDPNHRAYLAFEDCIEYLNQQGYLSQPEVIEVDFVSSFCEVVDDNNSAVVNHAVLEFYKSLYEKYKNKTIRIVDREGE